ncbi:MAG TPA: tetratricopeptide repeat protein, partial [Candidatus Obscuribacterales bacterium]
MTKTVSANLLIARPSPALILVFALVVSVCGCGPLVEDGKVSAAKQWRQSFDAAYAQRGAGKLASAETLYKEAFQALSRNQIEDARMGRTCAELSDLLVACGRYIEAEPYALKAITIFEKAWQPEARGESNRDIGVYLLRATGLLAKIYAEEGRASEAEKLFKKALSFDESVLASVELRHKITNDYADLLTRSGRSSEANILKGESKDLATSLTSEQASQTDNLSWKELKQEAKSAYQGGNYANAEKLYKKSIAQAEAEGSDDENVASSLRGLADVYNAQGKYSEAKPLVVRARG